MSVPTGSPRFTESKLRAFFDRQHGLVTSGQMQSLGLSTSAISKRVGRGELKRVLPAVYRSTLVPPSLHEGALAAVLWAGEDALGSHTTAAKIYGAELPVGKPHILVPPQRAPKSDLVIVHRGVVEKNDRRIRDGVPVTSPARTLVDLAGLLDPETLEAVAEDFFHRGVTTPMAVHRCLGANGGTGRRGAASLGALLADRDEAPLEKRLEVKLWRLLRKGGLRPVRQYWVTVAGRRYRLDFAFPVLKVGIEGHSFGVHGGRIKHRDDARRLADLVSVGWRIVPVTWEDVTGDPIRIVERVRAALAQAAA